MKRRWVEAITVVAFVIAAVIFSLTAMPRACDPLMNMQRPSEYWHCILEKP